jgi:nicotinamidase-related amidase
MDMSIIFLDMSMNIDPARTAFLSMDFQTDVLATMTSPGDVLARAADALAAARRAEIPVFHVVVGFRPGYPEAAPHNPMLAAVMQAGRLQTTSPGADLAPALRAEIGEPVIWKHRVSAFAGTDLEQILRARRIETLILQGVVTSGAVLSTLRHAADADYRLFVVRDACADRDDEVHRVLVEKVFPRQSTVITASEL